MVMKYPTIESNQSQQWIPKQGIDQQLLVELGRKNREKWRWTYKQRWKTDVSTLPPKKKKPVKVNNAVDNKVNYGKCLICWKPAISAMWYCGDHY